MDDTTRFWTKVHIGEDDECWPWKRGLDHGYGSIGWHGKSERAHRLAWMFFNGPIPEGKHVLHHCDNPPCCNPKHLYVGTNVENGRDRAERGRAVGNFHIAVQKRQPGWNRKTRDDDRRGGRLPKLSRDQVEDIRRKYVDGWTQGRLAEEYGVSHPTIIKAVHGREPYAW